MILAKNIISVKSINNKKYIIKWRLTNWCNYQCSYCIRNNVLTKKLPEIEKLFQEAKAINKILENRKEEICLKLIGGEITFLPLQDLLSCISSSYLKEVLITTNLSNNINYYKDLIKYFDSRNISYALTASYHDEFAKEEQFLNKVRALNNIRVEVVVTNENKERSFELLKKLKEAKINYLFDFDRTVEENDIRDIKEEINSIEQKQSQYEILLNTFEKKYCSSSFLRRNIKFEDNTKIMCNSTKHMLYINDGFVYNSACKYKERLCSINDLDYNKINKKNWFLCKGNSCSFCERHDIRII